MKSEPLVYNIDDLCRLGEDHWDGVRNYQARNFMKKMQINDQVFFYHSNCETPGIVGTMKIVKTAYPDHTAFDKSSKYYDAKSSEDEPRWFMVNVGKAKKLPSTISLQELKQYEELKELALVKKGNRLSVMPVTEKHWQFILSLI